MARKNDFSPEMVLAKVRTNVIRHLTDQQRLQLALELSTTAVGIMAPEELERFETYLEVLKTSNVDRRRMLKAQLCDRLRHERYQPWGHHLATAVAHFYGPADVLVCRSRRKAGTDILSRILSGLSLAWANYISATRVDDLHYGNVEKCHLREMMGQINLVAEFLSRNVVE